MAHQRFEFDMPAPAEVVFDAFHYHVWRARWDSLVGNARVVGGAPCPFVGAETENTGGGWLRGLSMRTRFVTFDRPHVAAASMIGRSFPFSRWAASMRHRDTQPGRSVLIYVYTIEAGPKALRWLLADGRLDLRAADAAALQAHARLPGCECGRGRGVATTATGE